MEPVRACGGASVCIARKPLRRGKAGRRSKAIAECVAAQRAIVGVTMGVVAEVEVRGSLGGV